MTTTEFPACRTTTCARKVCRRATANPEAAGWVHMRRAPPQFPHWKGWWCPDCIDRLHELLTSPDFRRAAGAAAARSWGSDSYPGDARP